MFERFTESSKAVLVEAQDVAQELGSPFIGAGHLLYGCAEGREETAGLALRECGVSPASVRRFLPRTDEYNAGGVDPGALEAIGIDYEGVRAAVERTFGEGALENAPDRRVPVGRNRKPRFTPNAKRSLELGLRAALELREKRVMPGHLLLGLLRLDRDLVLTIIEDSGASVATVSAAVLTRLAAA